MNASKNLCFGTPLQWLSFVSWLGKKNNLFKTKDGGINPKSQATAFLKGNRLTFFAINSYLQVNLLLSMISLHNSHEYKLKCFKYSQMYNVRNKDYSKSDLMNMHFFVASESELSKLKFKIIYCRGNVLFKSRKTFAVVFLPSLST